MNDIIDRFGGPMTMAERLSAIEPARAISRDAIYMWRRRGSIPRSWRMTVLAAADHHGIDLTTDDLLEGRAA